MKTSIDKIISRRLMSHASRTLNIKPERLIDIRNGQGRNVSEFETLQLQEYVNHIHNIKTFVREWPKKPVTSIIYEWIRNKL